MKLFLLIFSLGLVFLNKCNSQVVDTVRYDERFYFLRGDDGKYELNDDDMRYEENGVFDSAFVPEEESESIYLTRNDSAFWYSGGESVNWGFRVPTALKHLQPISLLFPAYFLKTSNGLLGCYDSLGRELLPPFYNEIKTCGKFFSVKKNDTYLLITEKEAIKAEGSTHFSEVYSSADNKYVTIGYKTYEYDGYGFWDSNGKLICNDCSPNYPIAYANKYYVPVKDYSGKWGIMLDGKLIIPYRYKSINSWYSKDTVGVTIETSDGSGAYGKISLKTLKEIPASFLQHTYSAWNYCTDRYGYPQEGCVTSAQFTIANNSNQYVSSITMKVQLFDEDDDRARYTKTHTVNISLAPGETATTPWIYLQTPAYYQNAANFNLTFISAR